MSTVNNITSLKTLLVPSRNSEVEFPGFPGFKLDLAFLSRDTLVNLRKRATKVTLKKGSPVESIDDDLFLNLYAAHAVKGWSGLTMAYLEQLALVDVSSYNPDDVLEYNVENVVFLMKNSTAFDQFVSDTVNDLSNFQNTKKTT